MEKPHYISENDESHNAMSLEILELDRFETAFAVSPEKDAATRRRFMTLFVESAHPHNYGSIGYVVRAHNAKGEVFAVKRLRTHNDRTLMPGEDQPRITQGQVAAFREEYRSQIQLAHMKGFPRLYGLGEAQGEPIIVMEWVEGKTLDAARPDLPAGAYPNSVRPATVAALGCALFSALDGLDRLAERPVHRDISPSNIMIRTSTRSCEAQVAAGDFDICLIDFGSATVLDTGDPRFTQVTDLWRNGTPEYAPPEMLTRDIANIELLRQSPSIDVYAVSSVLYELLVGRTPFCIAERGAVSPYRVKTETQPAPLGPAFGMLGQAIMAGLQRDQAQRPPASWMLAMCNAFLGRGPAPAAQSVATHAAQGAAYAVGDPSSGDASVRQVPPLADYEIAHLSMPTKAGRPGAVEETLKKAQEAKRKRLTRRSFAIGAVALVGVAAAAAVGGYAIRDRLFGGGAAQDAQGLQGAASGSTTSSIPVAEYTGGTLLLAQDADTMKWGYLNSQRKWVIEPRFDETPGFFSEGLANAKDPETGLCGYLDYSGAWAIEPTFNMAKVFTSEGLAAVVSSKHVSADGLTPNRVGWIDKTGEWVIKPTYAGGGSFKCGLAAFLEIGNANTMHKWGYLDRSERKVIPDTFYDVHPFAENGLAAAAEQHAYWGYIDKSGSWVISPKFAAAESFYEGLAAVLNEKTRLWGFINASGEMVIPQAFTEVRCFNDGRVAACDDQGKWGYVGTDGSWLLKPKFLRLGEISHGLAPAQDEASELFGYIDDQGEWVIPPQFPSVGLAAME